MNGDIRRKSICMFAGVRTKVSFLHECDRIDKTTVCDSLQIVLAPRYPIGDIVESYLRPLESAGEVADLDTSDQEHCPCYDDNRVALQS